MGNAYKSPSPVELRAVLYDLAAACDHDIFTDALECIIKVDRVHRALAAANEVLRGDGARDIRLAVPAKLFAELLDMAQAHVQDIDSGLEEGVYDASENQDLPGKRAAVDTADQMYRDATLDSPPMTEEQPGNLRDVLNNLKAKGLTFGDCVAAFGVNRDSDPYATAAQKKYCREGEIEIDDTTVLADSDKGNYLLAWVWISDEDAGVETDTDETEETGATT